MATYKAPIRDMRFAFEELHQGEELFKLPGYEEFDIELFEAIMEEAAKFCEGELNPLNRSGDEEGCRFEDGNVYPPKGFKEAYQSYCEGGWNGLSADPEYGGQGLPKTINALMEEMISSANLSFGLYPGLTKGAYYAVHAHGSDELKNTFLPKMVEGTWTGTMCLTEPHCGTDMGLARTKAIPQEDGKFRISGTKIFISAGDHDMTENIIHLVLAKTPDAPKGIKGISLFLVPKFKLDAEGNPGEANGVSCGAIEHKMGINASATCVINFDDAEGYLVGQLNKGMRAMFTMMNTERLGVGMQGLGISEASYQGAVDYARERLQGRALKGPAHPDKPADPIIVHPDVRRMLLTQRAYTEGMRAVSVWAAMHLDIANQHPDPEVRKEADDFVAIITPIVKALFTDLGFESANLGVQVFGGHGYIREHGMEQFVRDVRIAQLYEGTNGIQALDLIGRKLPAHMGRFLRRFFHPVQDYLEANADNEELAEFIAPMVKVFGRLQQATVWVAQSGLRNPDDPAGVATEYLRLFGFAAMAFMWVRSVEIAQKNLDGDEAEFYQAKIDTARFFMQRLLPQTSGLFAMIMAGSGSTMNFAESSF